MTEIVDNIIKTDAQNTGQPIEEVRQRFVSGIPLKRANEPEDIADMIVFLASPRARNISGQSINVDGGLLPN